MPASSSPRLASASPRLQNGQVPFGVQAVPPLLAEDDPQAFSSIN